jgi:hypothetical protein
LAFAATAMNSATVGHATAKITDARQRRNDGNAKPLPYGHARGNHHGKAPTKQDTSYIAEARCEGNEPTFRQRPAAISSSAEEGSEAWRQIIETGLWSLPLWLSEGEPYCGGHDPNASQLASSRSEPPNDDDHQEEPQKRVTPFYFVPCPLWATGPQSPTAATQSPSRRRSGT